MLINDPATVEAVRKAFDAYERALMRNDLEELDALFWTSPLTIRFGPGQSLYGIDAIRTFRTMRQGGSPLRTLRHTVITTFGTDFATTSTEFQREGAAEPGRQSQSWVRFPSGWRIVAAHVSLQAEGD